MNRGIVFVLGLLALLLCAVFLDIRYSQLHDLRVETQARREKSLNQLRQAVAPAQSVAQTPSISRPTTTSTQLQAQPQTPAQPRAPAVLHVPILMYHHIWPITAKLTKSQRLMSVTPESFEQQMNEISSLGYNPITPDQLLAAVASGTALPDKPVMITFDDGYRDQYQYAFPILKKFGFQATFFIITDYFRKNGYLDTAMLKELDASGLATLASHTMHHVWLTAYKPPSQWAEIRRSKEQLEQILGHEVDYFAYPYGKYDDRVIQMVRDAGYRMAFAASAGNTYSTSTLFKMQRVRVFDGEKMSLLLPRFSR